MELIFNILTITIAVASLIWTSVLAIKGWWKNRNIYGVELFELFSGEMSMHKNQEISDKLSSGNYTILHTEKINPSDKSPYDSIVADGPTYHILVAKIKK